MAERYYWGYCDHYRNGELIGKELFMNREPYICDEKDFVEDDFWMYAKNCFYEQIQDRIIEEDIEDPQYIDNDDGFIKLVFRDNMYNVEIIDKYTNFKYEEHPSPLGRMIIEWTSCEDIEEIDIVDEVSKWKTSLQDEEEQ